MSKFKAYGQHVVISALLIGLGIFGIYQFKRAQELEYAQNLSYSQIFTELTGYVDDVETELLKARLITDPKQLADLSGRLYRSAAAAKANLCALPLGETSVATTAEFLSQVGDYAHSVSMRVLSGEKMTDEELKTITDLGKYAEDLQSGLDELLVKMNNGDVSFSRQSVRQRLSGSGASVLADSIADLEDELHDYPSLVYDGPFSQHVTNKEPVFLKGQSEYDENMAARVAQSYIGDEVKLQGKGEGKIPSYYFENGGKKIEITKNGGNILWMLNNRTIGEKKLTLSEAKQYAAQFLRKNGYNDMTESYYDIKDDCAVLNYAWTQEGYTVFPDLVKVKVALDNGEIVGFEGRGYIMNHSIRSIPKPVLSPQDAKEKVSNGNEVDSVSYAVIPLDGGSEAFCYQVKGKIDDKHFLIYINTQTGEEEKILILLETDTGVLAV